jgi:hypothetical protein
LEPKAQWLFVVQGRTLRWWNLEQRAIAGEVAGPDTVTSAVVDWTSHSALFGTERGHVLKWRRGVKEAEPQPPLQCNIYNVIKRPSGATQGDCAHGSIHETEKGVRVCLYAVSHLIDQDGLVLRGCADGSLAWFELRKTGTIYRYSASRAAPTTVAFVGEHRVVLGWPNSELHLIELLNQADPPRGKLLRSLLPARGGGPVARDGTLFAVAQRDRLYLWRIGEKVAAGAVALPARAVWIRLDATQRQVEILLYDGRLVRHEFGES